MVGARVAPPPSPAPLHQSSAAGLTEPTPQGTARSDRRGKGPELGPRELSSQEVLDAIYGNTVESNPADTIYDANGELLADYSY